MIQSLGSGVTCLGLNLSESQNSFLENGYHHSTYLRKGYSEDSEWHNICQVLSKVSTQLTVAKIVNKQEAGGRSIGELLEHLEVKAGLFMGLCLWCAV